jgi:selenium-dependent xanthine dehydrogenase
MSKLAGAQIITLEGLTQNFKDTISKAFVKKGAVQCGFCSPGMIMRAKTLYDNNTTPVRSEIIKAISPNICRCTGYVKITDAIEYAFENLRKKSKIDLHTKSEGIGSRLPKYQALETALGKRPFTDDMFFEGMAYGALKFSGIPKAKIIKIDTSEAEKMEGVIRIVTAKDIPGERYIGLITKDWPVMIDIGETTNFIGDVLAGIVAKTEEIARKAVELIEVEMEEFEPVTNMLDAAKPNSPNVHNEKSNVIENCIIKIGNPDKEINNTKYVAQGIYETQRIEHGFLETETAIAIPEDDGIKLYSQGQGAYVDRAQVASILGLPEEKIKVIQVQNGGGFGGKEDLTVQGYASLFAWLVKKPVKVHFTREESIMFHPKRHPVWMDMTLGCDENGKFTALKLKAVGDTGAYASVGTKVMERVVGHATGAYHIPEVDISALTVYTNNIPSGAMRGFGVPQVVFAIESLIDQICKKANFNRWEIRYLNALDNGSKTATGQLLETGVGLKNTLLAVKEQFDNSKFAGIACGLKNTGIGNGMVDDSYVKIEIKSPDKVVIHHGWTEMGQGVHNMAMQTLYEETGISTDIMEVKVETEADLPTGMTTSSRATAMVGNAIINAAKAIKEDLKTHSLKDLTGRTYKGKFVCDWTTKPGAETKKPVTHFSYGYATQVVILDDDGKISKVIAAHDGGKVMNEMLFEGQIEGAVHMGLGYALTEDLPMKNGRLLSTKFRDIGILRAKEMPEVEVIPIEEKDPVGPYGAKGIGEIGLVPTAAAVAGAYYSYDGRVRYKLPMNRTKQTDNK